MDTPRREEEEEDDDETAALIPEHGNPTIARDERKLSEQQLASNIILASTLFERIAFYTLMANMSFNPETDKVSASSPQDSNTSFLFSGISYISTIIFAVISDAKLGRAKTIIVGFLIYVLGYVSAILITIPEISNCTSYLYPNPVTNSSQTTAEYEDKCHVWIRLTFLVIAIGTGAVQSNMAVFGAEQIRTSKNTSRYFDKYIIVVNISAAFTIFVMRSLYENYQNYRVPCAVAASMLFIAVLLFLLGWRYYTHVEPFDTVVNSFIPVYINAYQTWRQHQQRARAIRRGQLNATPHDHTDDQSAITVDDRPSAFLDYAKATYHGKFNDRIVNDVKSLRKAYFVFSLLIPYWLIYHQLSSAFSIQAQHMNVGNQDMSDIVARVWFADPGTIIIGILILLMFVYKCLDAQNRSLTIPTRFGIGMAFAVLSMCAAGSVEVFRQQGCDHPDGIFNQSSLSISYQLPQNIFMGCSEIFAVVASLEYAYFAAPRSAQTLFMSLRFCSLGIASFMVTGYFAIFAGIQSGLYFTVSL